MLLMNFQSLVSAASSRASSNMSVRSANFTPEQIDLILDSLEACSQLVTGKLGGKIPTKHHQKLAWEAVARRINEINVGSVKTGDQIRSKWWDLKYRAKVKATRLALKKINETGEKPTAEEILTPCEKRVLSLLGNRSRESSGSGNTSFDSSSVALKLLPVNILDLININEASNSSGTYVVANHNPDDSVEEAETSAEVAAEMSEDDFSNKILLRDIVQEQDESIENPSESENATSSYNWPFAVSKPAYSKSTERAKRCRAKKRKIMQEREDSFEKKAITTQENMASDINQINITLIEMKNSMKRYMERIDQKFDRMLDLLAIALNVEPEEIQDMQK